MNVDIEISKWKEKNGFNQNGETYCLINSNSYEIKEQLKNMGFKFSPLLKWHIEDSNIAPNFKYVIFNFDDLYEWDNLRAEILPKPGAAAIIQNTIKTTILNNSNFIGAIGDRLRDIPATFLSTKRYLNSFGGEFYIHTFEYEDNKLSWTTSKFLNLVPNQKVLLTGTIVDHKEFAFSKITSLKRCIIK